MMKSFSKSSSVFSVKPSRIVMLLVSWLGTACVSDADSTPLPTLRARDHAAAPPPQFEGGEETGASDQFIEITPERMAAAKAEGGESWAGVLSNPAYTLVGLAKWDSDPHRDLIAREDATNILYLFPGCSSPNPCNIARSALSTIPQPNRTYAGLADWNRDGFADLLYRDDAAGTFKVSDHYGGSTVLRSSWSGYTVRALADWNGDLNIDVIAKEDATGNLYYFPGNGLYTAQTSTRVLIATNFGNFTVSGVGRWESLDLYPDIIIEDNTTGLMYVFRGLGPSNPGLMLPPVQIGNGWNGNTVAGIGDWDGDFQDDIVARVDSPPFNLYFFKGTGQLGYPQYPTLIGTGF